MWSGLSGHPKAFGPGIPVPSALPPYLRSQGGCSLRLSPTRLVLFYNPGLATHINGGRCYALSTQECLVRPLFPKDLLVAPTRITSSHLLYANLIHGQNRKIPQASSTRYFLRVVTTVLVVVTSVTIVPKSSCSHSVC